MIRQATLSDIPALITLGRKFHEETTYVKPDFNEESIRTALYKLLDGRHLAGAWIAEEQGMIGVLVHPEWISGKEIAAELFWWVLDKGQGVGGQLLGYAEEWVKGCELSKLNVTIPYAAPPALLQWLWERGYKPMEIALTRTFD